MLYKGQLVSNSEKMFRAKKVNVWSLVMGYKKVLKVW